MYQNTRKIIGYKLSALDGDLGQVQDFYFDDKTWAVRYLVAATGTWLADRQVLVSPYALGRFDQTGEVLPVNLTRKQIEHSPGIDRHRPVSRQFEEAYHRYYGWPPYWLGGRMWGRGDLPVVMPPASPDSPSHYQHDEWDDVHLRSTQAVTGYKIHALDGEIGAVSGLIVDDERWFIRDLVVETGHWYAGKEILIATGKIDRIGREESKVFVRLTKDEIASTAKDEVAHARA
jgi:uncharacterized protein YrrD